MEHMDEAARHREAVALAELLKIFAGMFLMAAVGCLLLGAYGFDRDRKARNAMEKAVATVTEEYVHGGAYYVIFEADGETHEALMGYKKGTLNIGDQVAILYDPATYLDVRTDAPLAQPLYVLAAGGLCLASAASACSARSTSAANTPTPGTRGRSNDLLCRFFSFEKEKKRRKKRNLRGVIFLWTTHTSAIEF